MQSKQVITEKDIIPIIELRKQPNTYQAIAEMYGVSRERIRQILAKKAPAMTGWSAARKELYTVQCLQCKQPFHVAGRKVARKRKYCSFECFVNKITIYKTDEEWRKRNAERSRWWYHNKIKTNPKKYKQKLKENHEYYRKKLKSDPDYIKKSRERYIALKNNPKRWAAYLINSRKHYYKIMRDPVRSEMYRASRREYMKRRGNMLKKLRGQRTQGNATPHGDL